MGIADMTVDEVLESMREAFEMFIPQEGDFTYYHISKKFGISRDKAKGIVDNLIVEGKVIFLGKYKQMNYFRKVK